MPSRPRDVRSGREIRSRHILITSFSVASGFFDQQNGGVHDLPQIVRWDVRGHTDGDATRTIDEQIRDARR